MATFHQKEKKQNDHNKTTNRGSDRCSKPESQAIYEANFLTFLFGLRRRGSEPVATMRTKHGVNVHFFSTRRTPHWVAFPGASRLGCNPLFFFRCLTVPFHNLLWLLSLLVLLTRSTFWRPFVFLFRSSRWGLHCKNVFAVGAASPPPDKPFLGLQPLTALGAYNSHGSTPMSRLRVTVQARWGL